MVRVATRVRVVMVQSRVESESFVQRLKSSRVIFCSDSSHESPQHCQIVITRSFEIIFHSAFGRVAKNRLLNYRKSALYVVDKAVIHRIKLCRGVFREDIVPPPPPFWLFLPVEKNKMLLSEWNMPDSSVVYVPLLKFLTTPLKLWLGADFFKMDFLNEVENLIYF